MASRVQNAPDTSALRELPDALVRSGYVDAYASLGLLHLEHARLRERLAGLGPRLGPLVGLFLLGERVTPGALVDIDAEALEKIGVLLVSDGLLHTGGLILLPFLGQLLFVPSPPTRDVYYGDDSASFAARLLPRVGARCVDLATSAGQRALRLAASRCTVVAVEASPIARGIAELNIIMNGLEDRIVLQAAISPEPFDFVCAQPATAPLAGTPAHLGEDGLAELWGTLDILPRLLRPDAIAQISCIIPGDVNAPSGLPAIAGFVEERGLSGTLTVARRARLPRGAVPGPQLAHVYELDLALANEAGGIAIVSHVIRPMGG